MAKRCRNETTLYNAFESIARTFLDKWPVARQGTTINLAVGEALFVEPFNNLGDVFTLVSYDDLANGRGKNVSSHKFVSRTHGGILFKPSDALSPFDANLRRFTVENAASAVTLLALNSTS